MPRPDHRRPRGIWESLLLTAWLAGCASVTAPQAPKARLSQDSIQAPEPPAASHRDWSGRFSIRLTHFAAERQDAASGRFALRSQRDAAGPTLSLELATPFGQIMARGRREADGQATLHLADGRELHAHGLDALLSQALGWPLPIERLPEWLADQFESVLTRDEQGHVARATDSGWHIERSPRRWALQRPTTEGNLRIVLVLDR